MIRVKTRVFLANEKQSASPPKEICWGPTIYCSKQNKRKLKTKKKDALRKTHRI
jgi:hypothetical protein